jgi:DNA-binding SARP family transcriptional activator
MLPSVQVNVLGPVEVHTDVGVLDLGTPKQRAVVAALAMTPGRPVSVDALVDLLWGDEPPPTATGTLQAYVSGLRRVLEPDRERRRPATVLVTETPGYALRVAVEATDVGRFAEVVARHHRALSAVPLTGPATIAAEDLRSALVDLGAVLASWRGEPYADLGDTPVAVAERGRLDELRLVALEDRAAATLALGEHATAAAELESLIARHPLRERLWGLRALALVRAGRQAEALEVLARLRRLLVDELGLEPAAELRELQSLVLTQDDVLRWIPPPERAVVPPVADAASTDSPAGAPADVPAAATAPATPGRRRAAGWPMVGRDAELAKLRGLLDRAGTGVAALGLVVGEAGIGKSRIVDELAVEAEARGFAVAVGRGSQDEAAPPLWPWTTILRALGEEVPVPPADEREGDGFRLREVLADTLLEVAGSRPVLVVLEDLHWADTASLRTLGLLADRASSARSGGNAQLAVLATRRSFPEPDGALAEAGAALARAHAVRVDLVGIDPAATARLVEAITRHRAGITEARTLCERTDGNPFFVVEYARLAGERGDLADLLAEPDPPAVVHDVLRRRIAALPEETVRVLRAAAVLGRSFDLGTLAEVAPADPDDVLDLVEPAQVAGLLLEPQVETFWFAHALVRDVLQASVSASRRARWHVRAAEALAVRADRHRAEIARHWRAAGPAYVAPAWRAAVDAADEARTFHAHERSAELMDSALGLIAQDAGATPRDRYEVLLRLVDAHRWTAQWAELTRCVHEAIAIARELDDLDLLARAATATHQGTLWRSAPLGETNVEVVDALRQVLDALPGDDGALRCRALMALAGETYYATPLTERRDLVTLALQMADRMDADRLRLEAHQTASIALRGASTAPERLGHATAALDLARHLGEDRAAVVSACLRCVTLSELGRVDEMHAEVELARAEAERLRIPFGVLVLDVLVLPWLAMAGRFDQCAELVERVAALDAQMSLEHAGDATGAARMAVALWQGGAAELGAELAAAPDGPLPLAATAAAYLWRGGARERARELLAGREVELDHDDWFSLLAWSSAAEVALYLDRPRLGEQVVQLLAPYAGRSACANTSQACGPVDAYLAMATAAAGDRAAAAGHARAAEELAGAWGLPVFLEWFRAVRAEHGF